MNTFNQFPILNPATYNMLKKNTASNPEILRDLFKSFIEDAGALLNDVKTNASDDNNDGFYSNVHTLKGLCGTIGCSRMFEVLKVIDAYNKEKSFETAKSHIQELEIAFDETIKELEAEILSH